MIEVDRIVDALGGTVKVAKSCRVAKSTVSSWRERGIPAERWLDLVDLARVLGVSWITLEVLAVMHRPALRAASSEVRV